MTTIPYDDALAAVELLPIPLLHLKAQLLSAGRLHPLERAVLGRHLQALVCHF